MKLVLTSFYSIITTICAINAFAINMEYRKFSNNMDDVNLLIQECDKESLITEKEFNEIEKQARKDRIETDELWRMNNDKLINEFTDAVQMQASWFEYKRKINQLLTTIDRIEMNRQRYLMDIKTIPTVTLAIGFKDLDYAKDKRSANETYEHIRNLLRYKVANQNSMAWLESETITIFGKLKEDKIVSVKSIDVHLYEKAPVRHRIHIDNVKYKLFVFQLCKILPNFEKLTEEHKMNKAKTTQDIDSDVEIKTIQNAEVLDSFLSVHNLNLEIKKKNAVKDLLNNANTKNIQSNEEYHRFYKSYYDNKLKFIKELLIIIKELNRIREKIHKVQEVKDYFPVNKLIQKESIDIEKHSKILESEDFNAFKIKLIDILKAEKHIDKIYEKHIDIISEKYRENYKTRDVIVYSVRGKSCQDDENWSLTKNKLIKQIYTELKQSLQVLKHYSFLKVINGKLEKAEASTYYSEPILTKFWLATTSINRKVENMDTPYLKTIITIQACYQEESDRNENVYHDNQRNLVWLRFVSGQQKKNYNQISMIINQFNEQKKYGYNNWRLPTYEELKTILSDTPLNGKCSTIPIGIPCNQIIPTDYIEMDSDVEVVSTDDPGKIKRVDDTKKLNYTLVAPFQ